MNPIEKLLPRLDKVKQSSPQNWVACCPSHPDSDPSMTIRELDDGMLLVHCFAGCDIEGIVGAVGLSIGDLYVENPFTDYDKKQARKYFPAGDVLKCVSKDVVLVELIARKMDSGGILDDEDKKYLTAARKRLEVACEYIR